MLESSSLSSSSSHQASIRSGSLSSNDNGSRNGASPFYNNLGKVGRTPFHRFSKKQITSAGGENDEEDLYAPDLLELDEFENNEDRNTNVVHISSPLTHDDDHEILSSKSGVLLIDTKKSIIQTSIQDVYQDRLCSLIFSSNFSMRSFCKAVYVNQKHAKRKRRKETNIPDERFSSLICNHCEKLIPIRAWKEPSKIDSTNKQTCQLDDRTLSHSLYDDLLLELNSRKGIIPIEEEEQGEELDITKHINLDMQRQYLTNAHHIDKQFCYCTFSPEAGSPNIIPSDHSPISHHLLNHLFQYVYNLLWRNEPLSIVLDASDNSLRLYLRVNKASWILLLSCVHTSLHHATHTVVHIKNQALSWAHPLFSILGEMVDLPHHMGRTGEVIVTGIQSVKSQGSVSTGLGSSKLSAGVMIVGKEAISRVNTFLGLGSSNTMKESASVLNDKVNAILK